jgi:hypothetical protein
MKRIKVTKKPKGWIVCPLTPLNGKSLILGVILPPWKEARG